MLNEVRDNTLYFDGCSTVELARQYGTPLYVFSESEIVRRCSELRRCFLTVWPNTRAAYACKAFCTPAMLRLVQREGLCIDVVSGGELYTAIQAGFPAERIEFNGNNKLRAELELAVDYGIGRVILDGLQELPLLEEICAARGKKMNVLYRVTPGIRADSHDYIVTGRKDSKFGIPLDDDVLYPAVRAALDSKWVNFLGFHFHVGSQLFDNAPYLAALEVVLGLVREVRRRFGHTVAELNLGGGFGVTYTDEARPPYAYFLDPLMARLEAFCQDEGMTRPAVVIEPGRSIVAEAGLSLYTVGSIKDIRGVRKYVSVDGGMGDNPRYILYESEYEAVVANNANAERTEKVTVAGKCCESGDILLKDAMMPEIKVGDTLAVLATGAYNYSMASNYNRIPRAAVVAVSDGKAKVVVKRESYDDLIKNDVL